MQTRITDISNSNEDNSEIIIPDRNLIGLSARLKQTNWFLLQKKTMAGVAFGAALIDINERKLIE